MSIIDRLQRVVGLFLVSFLWGKLKYCPIDFELTQVDQKF